MQWFSIILGLFFMGIGILVKHGKAHNLIAGYNTMSREEKTSFDIEGYATFFRNFFVLLGLFIIIGFYIFYWVGWTEIAYGWVISSVFLTLPYLLIRSQQYNHSASRQKTKKYNAIAIIFLGLVFIGVMALIGKGIVPPSVTLQDHTLEISGMYGVKIPTNEITSIELMDQLPDVLVKTNGFNFANTLKGNFRLEGIGKGKLFIQKDMPPFVKVDLKASGFLMINCEDPDKTRELYNELQSQISNR
jgi:hypothetical protein